MASMNCIYIRGLKKKKGHDDNRALYNGEIYFKKTLLGEFSEDNPDGKKTFKYVSPEAESVFKGKVNEYFDAKELEPFYQPECHFIDRLIEVIATEKYYLAEKKKGYVGIGVTSDGRVVSIPKTRNKKTILKEFPEIKELYFTLDDFTS